MLQKWTNIWACNMSLSLHVPRPVSCLLGLWTGFCQTNSARGQSFIPSSFLVGVVFQIIFSHPLPLKKRSNCNLHALHCILVSQQKRGPYRYVLCVQLYIDVLQQCSLFWHEDKYLCQFNYATTVLSILILYLGHCGSIASKLFL